MKKVYRFLLVATLASFFYMFATTFKAAIELAIPNVKATILIENSEGNNTLKEVYEGIERYAKERKIAIHKIVFQGNENGNTEKNIFTFPKKDSETYSYPQNIFKTKTNFYTSKELNTENFLGSYVVTQPAPENLEKDFRLMGLDVTVEKFNVLAFFAGGLFTMTGNLFVILLFSTIVAVFFYKVSQRKKYGIIEVVGKSVLKESRKDFLIDSLIVIISISVFCFIYPIFISSFVRLGFIFLFGIWLVNSATTLLANYSGSISDKIKGEKPYKLLVYTNLFVKVLILLSIVIFTGRALDQMEQAKETYLGLSFWKEVGNYYQLAFNSETTLFVDFSNPDAEAKKNEADKINKILYPLIENSEKNGAILASSNEDDLSGEGSSSNFDNDSLPFMSVNHNFLEVVTVLDNNGNRIYRLPQDKFYCLVPENEKNKIEQIEEKVRGIIALNQHVSGDAEDGYRGEVEILYLKSNQKIFNFNVENPKNSLSKNPIILVLSLQMIGKNIDNWIAEISQSHYLFEDAKEVQQFLSNNGLESQFFGIISAKDTGNALLQESKEEYKISISSLCLLVILFVIIAFYNSLVYVELEKKRMFLQYILGDSLWMRHQVYYLKMFLISLGTLSILVSIKNEFLPTVLGVLFFESILLVLTTMIAEKNIRLEVLKKGD